MSLSFLKYQIIWDILWHGKFSSGCKMSCDVTKKIKNIYESFMICKKYHKKKNIFLNKWYQLACV